MNAGELLRRGTATLRQAGLEWPRLEAEVLLAHAWGCSREELLIHPEREAPEVAAPQFLALVGQRAGGVPAAYLTGVREFMSLPLAVTPAVLIPRPETEMLVEEVLRWLAGRPENGAIFDQPLVADVGTGSGAIAVSLAHYHLAVQVAAIDVSEEALSVAAGNAGRHGLADRISFLAGDLLAPLLERISKFEVRSSKFDLKKGIGGSDAQSCNASIGNGRPVGQNDIAHDASPCSAAGVLSSAPPGGGRRGTAVVANLPYIPTAAWSRLPPEVRREPRLALDGGGDGLDLYRRLLPQAIDWLAPGGLLACEIDPGQAKVLSELLQQDGWRQVRLIRDYRGEERVVAALCPGGEG